MAFWNDINTYWLLGPLILAFTTKITEPDRQFLKSDIIHLFPFLMSLGTSLIFWFSESNSAHIQYVNSLLFWKEMPLLQRFSPSFMLPASHFILYLLISSLQSLKYWRDNDAARIKPQLSWLTLALAMSYLMMLSMLITLVVSIILNYSPSPTLFAVANLSTVAGLFITTLLLIKYGSPVATKAAAQIDALARHSHDSCDVTQLPATESGRLTEEQQSMLEKLDLLMMQKEYFKDPELNQLKLAEHLGVTRHKMSELLSLHSCGNFYDYVNRLRVDAVKQKIINHSANTNLLNLAFECGFSSKSGFNSVFKKVEGQTPTQFRNQLKEKV